MSQAIKGYDSENVITSERQIDSCPQPSHLVLIRCAGCIDDYLNDQLLENPLLSLQIHRKILYEEDQV